MSDDVARAIGSGGIDSIEIAGKQCEVRPLSLRELGEVERECLHIYKRQFLETYSRNLDLLDEVQASRLMETKLEEVAKWDISELPPQFVYDPNRVTITDGLTKWVVDEFDVSLLDKDGNKLPQDVINSRVRANVATALDGQLLTDELYENLAGAPPKKVKVNYVSWWITGTFDGMMTLIWLCFKHNGVTRAQVEETLSADPSLMAYFARSIEHLSTPAVGNG